MLLLPNPNLFYCFCTPFRSDQLHLASPPFVPPIALNKNNVTIYSVIVTIYSLTKFMNSLQSALDAT